MSMRKFRWSRVYESSEEELLGLLSSRKITAKRIAAHADAEPTDQTAKGSLCIWCAEGSLTVRTESTSTPMQPGDALTIEAGASYSLQPGISGYVYYLSR